MAAKLLQINFKYSVSHKEYRDTATTLGPAFAEVEGLKWKIWIIDEANSTAGGIYLFESEEALGNFLNGPLAAQVKAHPALTDLSAVPFDVIVDATEMARGPV